MELLQMENIITEQLRLRLPELTHNAYPNMTFSTETTEKQLSFPNVYVHELEPSETGNSIPNQVIHAIRDTIQIEVTTNTTKTDARVVANACVSAMKSLHYGVVTFPLYQRRNNLHRFITRFRRVVANGDTFD